jgi:hypothetical protein
MIYPKEYIIEQSEIESDTAFLIMPFNDNFTQIHGVITSVCKSLSIKSRRADDIFATNPIMTNILKGITSSEIIIADITEKNPNVYYELGIAHTCRDKEVIIIITQNTSNLPFDISHLSILKYDLENIPEFKFNLKEKISVCRNASIRDSFFRQFLRAHNIDKNEIEKFIELAKRISEIRLDIVFRIMANKVADIESKTNQILDIPSYFATLEEYNSGIVNESVLIIKKQFFSSIYILSNYPDLTKSLLVNSKHDLIKLDKINTFSFIADLCFILIELNKLKEEAINWIVDYLHNYRMGRIDIVRSKIENFLINISDVDIDNTILKLLESDRTSVRESAADIIGQKELHRSIVIILNLLKYEKNPHVARSYITALTRLKATTSATAIYEWMEQNRDKWGTQAVSASLKNVAITALRDLNADSTLIGKLYEMG